MGYIFTLPVSRALSNSQWLPIGLANLQEAKLNMAAERKRGELPLGDGEWEEMKRRVLRALREVSMCLSSACASGVHDVETVGGLRS